jgi:hypothetical protein
MLIDTQLFKKLPVLYGTHIHKSLPLVPILSEIRNTYSVVYKNELLFIFAEG